MKRLMYMAVLTAALVCAACPRERGAPMATSTSPVTVPKAKAVEPAAATPMATPEAELAATAEAELASTTEAEIAATAEEEPVSTTEEGTGCFRAVCLGMKLDAVAEAVTGGALAGGKPEGCKHGGLRELPTPLSGVETRRYIYNNNCGGAVDSVTFYFYKGTLTAYDIYFSPAYFDETRPEDFIEGLKELFGETTREGWECRGVRGFIVWENGGMRATLKIFNSRPFVLIIEDLSVR